ncbi:MAG: CHAP domain-containing protein [Proteobacteria bacterium]|nr:CHAP domain-containing protein [Pseudomonadota bacterium]
MRSVLLFSLITVGCASKGIAVPGPLASVGSHVPVPPADEPVDLVARDEAPREVEATSPAEGTHPKAEATDLGHAVADAAEHYLKHTPRGFRDDCSGFVCAVYDRAGVGLTGNTASLWAAAKDIGATHKRKVPTLGDLAFFDNTYDRNGNGKFDDELTHVGVVMTVEEDGTIVVAHAGTSQGRTQLRMNLLEPSVQTAADGTVKNDYLRARYRSDRPGTKRLAGELWRGFATVAPDEIDAWAGN